MKKILSLILFLILCFGVFVSCDNETSTESQSEALPSEYDSSSETISQELILELKGSGEKTRECLIGRYYYHITKEIKIPVYYRVFDNYEEAQCFFEKAGITCPETTEETFEKNYIFVLPNESNYYGDEIDHMGYYDIKKTKNGYEIMLDALEYYSGRHYHFNDLIGYDSYDLEPNPGVVEGEQPSEVKNYCDIVFVPKNKLPDGIDEECHIKILQKDYPFVKE